MRKAKLLQVRLTEQEDKFIEQKMIEHDYKNKSEYVCDSVISPLRHDNKRQQKMLYEINKIGVNLNQAIRKMHASGVINTDLLASVDACYSALHQLLEEYRNYDDQVFSSRTESR
jgi:Arc/MetJ-type ribon-helix-helix transcriptional regulator